MPGITAPWSSPTRPARPAAPRPPGPDAAEALAATGYERGTITPIGSEPEWPVLIDQRLVGCRVAMGAGAHGFSAFLDIDDLVRSYDAVVADLVD